MSSTNKTTNYNLSQYVGADKPTYLGDYNGDMLKIDTQMKANADSASSAYTLANTAKTTADTAEGHAQTALTNASTADEKAVTAQTTASSANLTAQQALALTQLFNLNTFEQISSSVITTNLGTFDSSNMNIAKNSDGTLAKIYGSIRINFNSLDGNITVSFPSSLRPQSAVTILNAINYRFMTPQGDSSPGCTSITIGTDGTITTGTLSVYSNFGYIDFYFLPCLYWVKDFGDVPDNN